MLKTASTSIMAIAFASLTACAPALYQSLPQSITTNKTDALTTLVSTQSEFSEAVKKAVPGSTIVLANGEWKDFDAVFDVTGTEDSPIYLKAETPGKVLLTGQSSLRLAGEHLIISGLLFTNGYTPRSEVISFRRDSKRLANNARVTNTAIVNYSNPDRTQRDLWVGLYGKNNEFDHNHLEGKTNSGPTLAVRLNSPESQDNHHHIHHNYFGPRPVLGSNGGETFRIGTSHYSLTNSNTLVENNFFDRCSGEVEIISNKSGGNTYRNNTFFESRGTLTLRHGNGTTVENNLFDGNGAEFTGGVRVINADQTIRNNYFKDLTGTRFSGALVVMNGVPNSPINRYHQVDGAVIEDNVFQHVASIELGEGSDAERSATPVNSRFSNNTIITKNEVSPFKLHDDMSGISFSDNIMNAAPPSPLSEGFSSPPMLDQQIEGSSFGVDLETVGTNWHSKRPPEQVLDSGKTISVSPGENAISDAIQSAKPGDILVLDAGTYTEATIIKLGFPLTITSAPNASDEVFLEFERSNMFVLENNGALKLSGLNVSGVKSPDNVGNTFITTSALEGSNYHLHIENTVFDDFDVNRSFSIIGATKGSMYQTIRIKDSTFKNITGSAIKLNAETDDYGMYNVEFLEILDTTFKDISGPAIAVYRGGRDESTFGPQVKVEDSHFDAIATATSPTMDLHGIQSLTLRDNTITASSPFLFTITTGKPEPVLDGNIFKNDPSKPALMIKDLRK